MRGAALSHARRVSSPTLASIRGRSTASALPDSRPSLMHVKTTASPVCAALHSRPASSAKTRSPPEGRDLLRPDSLGILSIWRCLESLALEAARVKGGRRGRRATPKKSEAAQKAPSRNSFLPKPHTPNAPKPLKKPTLTCKCRSQSPSMSNASPSASRSRSNNVSSGANTGPVNPASGPIDTLIARRAPSGQSGMDKPATSRRIN